jgi:hypothetical protein
MTENRKKLIVTSILSQEDIDRLWDKIIQRIWISYGYKSDFVAKVGSRMWFNLNNGGSGSMSANSYCPNEHVLCGTQTDFIKFIENPQEIICSKSFYIENGCLIFYRDESVYLKVGDDTTAITGEEFDRMVAERNKLLKKGVDWSESSKESLIKIKFSYPSDKLKGFDTYRTIKLVKADDTYIEGYDTNDNDKYKRYRKDKVVGRIDILGI